MAMTNPGIKEEFVYDADGPDVRFVVENRRFRAEQYTLINLRQKFNLASEAGRDLVEPRLFFEGKHPEAS